MSRFRSQSRDAAQDRLGAVTSDAVLDQAQPEIALLHARQLELLAGSGATARLLGVCHLLGENWPDALTTLLRERQNSI